MVHRLWNFNLITNYSYLLINSQTSNSLITTSIQTDYTVSTSGSDIPQGTSLLASTASDYVNIGNVITDGGTRSYTGGTTGDFQWIRYVASAETSLMTLAGTGALKLTQYAGGTFNGTPVLGLGVDGSGNVVTSVIGGFSGIYGGSGTVPTSVVATLTDNLTF